MLQESTGTGHRRLARDRPRDRAGLGSAGARVIGTSTPPKARRRSPSSSASHGYNGRGAVLDVGAAASIDALLAQLEAAGELPTILVNNAAITRDTLLLRMKPEDWDG